jgi:SAM-dependent methyltransferase
LGSVLDTVHGGLVHQRRVQVLSRHLADVMPRGAQVLDVGCGDGLIGSLIRSRRSDVEVSGIDIAVRGTTHIPVREFDGRTIPLGDEGADVVMLVDVLHHADDPRELLGEAARVARRAVVLKDVTPLGPLSDRTLRFMDWVGNARHGVPLPYRFWSQEEWRDAFADLGLSVEEVRRRLGLYPLPASLLFEKRMHFIARLCPAKQGYLATQTRAREAPPG